MDERDEEFEAFVEGRLSAAEWFDRLIGRELANCARCERERREVEAARLEARWVDRSRWAEPQPAAPAAEEARAAEGRAVERAMKELRRLTADRRLAKLERAWSLFDRPALVAALLGEARARLGNAPKDARSWVDCAAVATRTVADPEAQARWRIRVQALRASVELVLGDLRAAAAFWPAVYTDLAGHPLEGPAQEAEIWSLESSLHTATRDFATASRLLDRAEKLYRMAGDRTGEVKVLIKRGTLAEYAGDSASAVGWLLKANSGISTETDPRLYWIATNNLAASLASQGQAHDAAAVLDAARPVFFRVSDGGLRMRLNWVEAKVAFAAGREDEADQKLRTAASDCLHLNLTWDYALVQLDLAALYLSLGQPYKVRAIAAALTPVLASQEVFEEAKNALRLFRQAAEADQADALLVAELRRYLPLAQLDPRYAFRRGERFAPPPAPPPVD